VEVKQPDADGVLLRQALYRFCAGALLYPEPERMETLKAGGEWLAENLDGAWPNPELRERLQAIIGWVQGLNGDLTKVEGDWVSLFGVSRTSFCYPYEGAMVEPTLVGVLQAGLQQEYAEAGLTALPEETPDHISVQLEFMSFLCGLEGEAIRRGREDVRKMLVQRQNRFLEEHLCKWLPDFTERVEKAEGQIFAEICAAVNQMTESERDRTGQKPG